MTRILRALFPAIAIFGAAACDCDGVSSTPSFGLGAMVHPDGSISLLLRDGLAWEWHETRAPWTRSSRVVRVERNDFFGMAAAEVGGRVFVRTSSGKTREILRDGSVRLVAAGQVRVFRGPGETLRGAWTRPDFPPSIEFLASDEPGEWDIVRVAPMSAPCGPPMLASIGAEVVGVAGTCPVYGEPSTLVVGTAMGSPTLTPMAMAASADGSARVIGTDFSGIEPEIVLMTRSSTGEWSVEAIPKPEGFSEAPTGAVVMTSGEILVAFANYSRSVLLSRSADGESGWVEAAPLPSAASHYGVATNGAVLSAAARGAVGVFERAENGGWTPKAEFRMDVSTTESDLGSCSFAFPFGVGGFGGLALGVLPLLGALVALGRNSRLAVAAILLLLPTAPRAQETTVTSTMGLMATSTAPAATGSSEEIAWSESPRFENVFVPLAELSLAVLGGEVHERHPSGVMHRAAVGGAHLQMAIGADPGRSIGYRVVVEAAVARQEPDSPVCMTFENCDDFFPGRTQGSLVARVGTEQYRFGASFGFAQILDRSGTGEQEVTQFPSFTARVGLPEAHFFGDLFAGPVHAFRTRPGPPLLPWAVGAGRRVAGARFRIGRTDRSIFVEASVPVRGGWLGLVGHGLIDGAGMSGGLSFGIPLGPRVEVTRRVGPSMKAN